MLIFAVNLHKLRVHLTKTISPAHRRAARSATMACQTRSHLHKIGERFTLYEYVPADFFCANPSNFHKIGGKVHCSSRVKTPWRPKTALAPTMHTLHRPRPSPILCKPPLWIVCTSQGTVGHKRRAGFAQTKGDCVTIYG